MRRLVVAIALIASLLGGGLVTASPTPPATIAAAIAGTDACAMLSDDDLFRATEAVEVVSRQPGPLPGLDAGCTWELGPVEDGFAAWIIFMGIMSPGGRAWFDLFASEDAGYEEIAGIGDAAMRGGSGDVVTVQGDTFLMLNVIGPGGDAPEDGDVARQLAWRMMSRVEAAPAPSVTPAPSATPRSAVRDLVIRLRAPEFGDDAVDATVELLARSGIGTFAEPTASEPLIPVAEPASPVRLLRDQVRAMALEAWAGGGLAGETIDELVPEEPDLASGSEVLAAYVTSASTEGAEAARALMGVPDLGDPAAVPFPQLVAILFLSDLVRDSATPGVAGSRPRGGMALGGVIGPGPITAPALMLGGGVVMAAVAASGPRTAQAETDCTELTGFIHRVFLAVLEALARERPGGAASAVAVEVWGTVHLFASESGRQITLDVGQPVLELFARVAATVGLSSLAISAVRPWTLAVTAEPPVTAKGINGPGEPGAFVLRVETGGAEEWPANIEACAQEAGFTLPDLRPSAAVVTWSAVSQSPDGLVAPRAGTTRLDADRTARLDFTTLSDEVDAPLEERVGRIHVTAEVERPGLETLARLASAGIATPSTGEAALRAQLEPTIQRVRDRLLELIASGSAGAGTVIYHVPMPTPSPKPSGTPAPTPTAPPRAVMVRLERPRMGAAEAGTVLELYSCTGPYGHWSGVIRFGGIDAGEGLAVPWADLPVEFRIQGGGGIRRSFTTVSGVIPSNIPAITYDIDAFLDFTVDGRTMEIASRVNIEEQIEGGDLMGTSEPGEPVSLPIEPAPEGACP